MIFRLSQFLVVPGLLLCCGLLISTACVGQEHDTSDSDANTSVESRSVASEKNLSQVPRWQLPVETPLLLTVQQTTDTVTTVAQQTLRMRLEVTATFDWLVDHVDDSGEMHIRQKVTSLRLRLVPADLSEPVLFDSTLKDPLRGAARELASAVSPLVGTEFVFSLSPLGEYSVVEIPEATAEVYRQLEAASPSEMPFAGKRLEGLVEQSLIRFPEEPVAPGDIWRMEVELAHPLGKLLQTNEFTYRGQLTESERAELQGSALHRIEIAGRLAFASPERESSSAVALRGHDLSGNVEWDPELGGIVRGRVTQRLVTESPFQDQLITVRLSGETTWQLQRK